jgi:hypothetical protein
MKELLLCQSFAEQTQFLSLICSPEFSVEPIDATTQYPKFDEGIYNDDVDR